MTNSNDNRPSQKVLMLAFFALFFGIVGTAGILYYLGIFSSVTVEKSHSPSYKIAYLPHTGPYNKIGSTFEKVAAELGKANISPVAACAIFLDDPSTVAEGQLRSKVGFIVGHRDSVPETLEVEKIEGREVIKASFDGSPMIGSYKAYQAMKEWSRANGYTLNLPALEIYHEEGIVEYQLPISRK